MQASGRKRPEAGRFREGLDWAQIYVTIAAMSRFHLAGYSLSMTVNTDMSKPEWRRARLAHALELLEGYLTAKC
ncbi:hypothetical protein ASD47_24315 [Caulobacter sp. Root1472]|nr:hypothetical protein ASD47_24315 [Caulobacter sp. Root1472]